MTPTARDTAKDHETVQDRGAREARTLARAWREDARWTGVAREYTAEDVLRLRGSVRLEYSLARLGAERLWAQLTDPKGDAVRTFGALTGARLVTSHGI